MCAKLRVEEATHVDLFRGGYATAHAELYSRLATLRVRYSRTKKEELTKYALYLPVIRDRDIRVPRFSLYPLVKKRAARRQTGPIRRCPMRCPPPPLLAPAFT